MRDIINYLMKKRYFHIKHNDGYYKKILLDKAYLRERAEGEDLWLNRWRKYYHALSLISYRIFSRYIGPDINIVPNEILETIIEPVLTPAENLSYYSDKNSLDKILPLPHSPKVLIRNINGVFYDENYCHLTDDIDLYILSINKPQIILKPTLECSGKGVRIFTKLPGGKFTDKDGHELSASFLDNQYRANFLIQECIEQSKEISQFNESSVNTIRIATYRDVKGIVHPLKSVLRIGRRGADIDNAHAGGMFCGIDATGNLGNYVCDWLGNRQTVFNGIDFMQPMQISNFNSIVCFARKVSECVLHHDLVALDIALSADNKPCLLEINVGGFSGWLFQFTSGSMFGEYTEEIISRCWNVQDRVNMKMSPVYQF